MSRLNVALRPFTVFDPNNREHRQCYHDFVKHNSWARCPYNFILIEGHGDLTAMVQRSLAKFYSESEFVGHTND